MIARRTINPGEDLTISYVDFNRPRDVRRQALRDGYGFWCECPKCVREEKAEKAELRKAEQAKKEEADKRAKEKKDAEKLAAQMEALAVDDDTVDDML